MKIIKNKRKYILIINWITIIIIWILHKKSSKQLQKIKNELSQAYQQSEHEKLIINLTNYVNWLTYYSKIFSIFAITLTTLSIIELLLQQIFFTNKRTTNNQKIKLPQKLTHHDLKNIKIKLAKAAIKIPKFKKRHTLLQQTNIILKEINAYLKKQEIVTNINYWQYLNIFFITNIMTKKQQLENELYTLKSWLETQKLLFSLEKEVIENEATLPPTTITNITEEPINVDINHKKELSTHFLDDIWPKWFNYNLTITEKKLLNTAYQHSKNNEEKKFWKLIKENEYQIKNKGVPSFVETSLMAKNENKIAKLANQEITFFSKIASTRKQKIYCI